MCGLPLFFGKARSRPLARPRVRAPRAPCITRRDLRPAVAFACAGRAGRDSGRGLRPGPERDFPRAPELRMIPGTALSRALERYRSRVPGTPLLRAVFGTAGGVRCARSRTRVPRCAAPAHGHMRRERRSSLWPPGGSHGRARAPPRFAGRGCRRGPPQRSPALARLAAAAPAAPSGVARPLPGPASSSGPPSAWEGLSVVPERRTEAQGLSSFPNGVLKAALCSPRPLKRPFVLRGRTCRRSRTAYQKRGACRRSRTAS